MIYPKLEEYIGAIKSLQSLDPEKRDTARLFGYYSLFETINPRIRGHINTRKSAVGSWGFKLIPYDEKDSEKAADAEIRLSGALKTLVSQTAELSIYGVFGINIEWENVGGALAPKAEPIQCRILKPINKDRARIQRGRAESIIGESTSSIAGSDSSMPGGEMASVGIAEIIRGDMLMEWGSYNKKLKGVVQAIEAGASDDEKKAAIEALKTVTKHSYLLTSDMIDFKFHQITQGGAGESFRAMLEHLNNSIAIALVGQANVSEIPKKAGSRAALQVQKLITDDIMWRDLATAEYYTQKLLDMDYKLNYSGDRAPWRLQFTTDESEDYEANVAVVREATAAGIPLIKSEVYQKIGFTMPSGDDDIFALES